MQTTLWAPNMTERDISLESPTSWQEAPRAPALANVAGSAALRNGDRRRHRPSGEVRAQSCECSEKQTTFHFTSLPCRHFTTSLHAPNLSQIFDIHSAISF